MRLVCAWAWGSSPLLLAISAALSLSAPEGIQFTDIAKTAGIRFTHYKGSHGVSTILEEAGPGVCVADFDGDGFEDIYFVNGRDLYGDGIEVHNALYRNNGNGTFTDVTERAGVPGNAYGLGCIWGDYDNDGHPDLYVTQYGKNILYRNNGDGTFTDVTQKAHVDGTDFGTVFHTGATFFDYDRDGYLDLYAGGYVEFGPGSKRTCKIGFDVQASCAPSEYKGSPAVLYHNNRDGTFTNVTKAAKIFQPNGKNLSIAAADYDNDGWPDLFVANDGIDVYLYHNEHNGTFKEVALTTGIALTANGNPMAAMCMSLGDYDNDGFLDLYVSDFQGAGDHIWHNDREGFLEEVSDRAGLTTATQGVLSFGGGFFDYDNDGLLDLFIANGHVYQSVEKTAPNIHYKQINSLFHNAGGGRFTDVTTAAGSGFTTPYLGRGAAFADFDNDGYVDIVVGNNGDPPLLLHNSGATSGNHFINFRLVGTRSDRDAMGARIKLTSGGVSQIREIAGGGSYLSQSDLRAHFGLGRQTRVESMEISWPSGLRQSFTGIDADRFYVVEEGKDVMSLQRAKP
jgi:enediyne biosynthesis protein E4